ncbi:glutamate receptor-interacting [Chlorella sorokiniana]|uniref:Glutamate receptor-interacting n=1 Tax=Chlorella sorokiniana TaxID=3076 RepID=A0A2P6TSM9_CHLSO|nr:glutamate receptor-interacting [Chlorella sorokiniana]|eukprot:PRW57053.1 glutamate receptor-interacting [Chlorella sorokiniana]
MASALSQRVCTPIQGVVTSSGLPRRAAAPAALPCRRPAGSGGRRQAVIRSAYIPPAQQAPPDAQKRLSLELPTDDFQKNVTLTALKRKRGGTAIIVQEVEAGSASEAAGVRPGQQLLGLSDTLRSGEVWELNGLASLKYVRQMVDGRAAASISVRLTGEPLPEYQQALAAARATAAASGSETSGDDEPLTAAEAAALAAQLDAMNDQATARKQAAREEKLEQRRAYELDNLEKKRSNAPLFAAAIGFFLILPAGIVVAALSSGYLDSLGPR